MNYLKNRLKAFGYAFSGIRDSFLKETHMKLHLLSAVLVVALGLFLNVSKTDWLILALAIALVIAFEMINTAIEKLCDVIKPEQDPKIKYIKDVAAGAVLVVCVFALVAGFYVFLPYLRWM
jgi:diacylglycerol kinase (ATP)